MASILLQVAVSAALSYVANLLAPAQEGPRLQDLKLHGSSYGVMNPLLWGTMRVPDNVIDETDLVEHKHSSGGKGGPQVNTYTYTVSVAVRVCDVELASFNKIWANGRLIYGPGADADKVPPVTFYLGTETQLPDPTFEAIHGVGNVPAYRGVAYAVFTDWELTDFGNTLPNLNFEVSTKRGNFPLRIATLTYARPGEIVAAYDSVTKIITVDVYNIHGNGFTSLAFNEFYYNLDGTPTGTPILDATPGLDFGVDCIISNSLFYFNSGGWWKQGSFLGTITGGSPWSNGVLIHGTVDYIFCTDQTTHGISRYPVVGGMPALMPDRFYPFGGTLDASYGSSDNGRLYMYRTDDHSFYEFDENLVLLRSWTESQIIGTSPTAIIDQTFTVYKNMVVFAVAGLGFDNLVLLDITDTALTLNPQAVDPYAYGRGPVIDLGNGYVLGNDGITLLNPAPQAVVLSEIVADLCQRSGLTDYDVSALTDLVDGYLVTQQSPSRTMLQPLRDTYFFDAVESDDLVKFVKRGGKSVITIPDDDLAAHVDGDTLPPILATTRTQDVDVPAVVNVSYVNPDADYQTGNQVARRMVTNSQSEVTIQLPVSLHDLHAKGVADAHLYEAEIERQRYSFQTTRKYAKYEPTDIVTVQGQAIVIRQKQEVRAGVIKFDGVSVLSSVYALGGGGVATLGHTTSTTLPSSTSSALLLDLPLVNDADAPNGFYAAMYGTVPWPGEALMKSSDGGASYSPIVSTTIPAVTGTTADALGNFYGGNVFDESNVLTVVVQPGQTLSSVNALAVLNGANEAVVGAEVIQYKNAELVGTDTYDVSGFLRGRLGTEWAMGGHAIGERFVLLPVPRASLSSSEVNVSRSYKPVTDGGTLAGTVAQNFTNTGVSLKPYSPVLLGGGTDASGNVTLNWTRRTRIGGAWAPFVDVPLSESSEAYKVQIWNADYSQVARIIDATSPTASYSSADQVTDFGANQQTIYFSVGQMGSIGIGYQTRGTAIGAGASNGDPLSPISPYQSPTSGSSSPPPVAVGILVPMIWTRAGINRVFTAPYGAFACGSILAFSFTTGSVAVNNPDAAGLGRISGGNTVDGPVTRVACLSTVQGDFSGSVLGPNSLEISADPFIPFSVGTNTFGYPELAINTTYYLNVKNDDGFGVCTCTTSSCDMYMDLLRAAGT